MRQCYELTRHAVLCEHLFYIRLPATGTNESRAKAIRLPQLKTYAVCGGSEFSITGVLTPQGQHFLLDAIQIVAFATTERTQRFTNLVPRCAHLS